VPVRFGRDESQGLLRPGLMLMLMLMLMKMLLLLHMLMLMLMEGWFGSGPVHTGYWTPSLVHPTLGWFGSDRRPS
jgi:hypothetical protein